eukprot:TRINITY_DN14753_c1_g4_i2.p2 TRINITY_DN14753_c1_g4~~TRINITY_DN14753_c1_g4_i2.p2  ORF type:complete len:391 (+),score=110.49 TRINITY_DN14753_c1_g4_i2:1673-2845(+)
MDGSPYGMLGDNPQGEVDGSPADVWGAGWGAQEDMMTEVNNIHAQHVTAVTSQATSAAWHADIAAKQASNLAQWVQYLWNQVATLQQRINELEEWKKKTLDEMTKLRFEHKILRRSLHTENEAGHEEDVPPVPKAKSLPLMLAEHVDKQNGGPKAAAKRRTGKAVTLAVGEDVDLAKTVPLSVPLPPGLEAPPAPAAPVAPPASAPPPPPQALAAAAADAVASEDLSLPLSDGAPEGVYVERGNVDGTECECAEWRIGHFSTKLKSCMGRALVSSPFSAWGIEDLRLMVFPEGKEVVKGPRSKRQKDMYSKKVTEGPLEGCLKLKVPECPAPHILTYYLKIGNIRKGPFRHNFAENTVNGCSDFGVDWLQQVDADQGIVARVEILALEKA